MTGDTEMHGGAMRSRHEEPPGGTRPNAGQSSPTFRAMPGRTMAQENFLQTQMSAIGDTKISIAVDPVALITTECITVTSAMRKHARWAHSSVSAILGGGPSMATGNDISRLPRQNDRTSTTARTKLVQAGRMPTGAVGEDDSLASRWGLRGKKGKSMQDNPLLSAFARLRNDLRGCTGGNISTSSLHEELNFA